jgi:hypothetical protein
MIRKTILALVMLVIGAAFVPSNAAAEATSVPRLTGRQRCILFPHNCQWPNKQDRPNPAAAEPKCSNCAILLKR